MEDIEYLEEYEDFILPKTLNYSEEFPVNAIEGDLLDESCNNLNPQLHSDVPECEDDISSCPPIQNTRKKKPNLIKIINTEVLRTPALVQNFIKDATPNTSITQGTQQLNFRYNASFIDRITQSPALQRVDKYKSVATVKPNLQRTKTFQLSTISPPFASTETRFRTISSSEYVPKLDGSNKDDDAFLDYAVQKHAVDDFSLDFNLDTAEISDICSDSLNFSDDYNEDIFCLDSLLSSEDIAKKKLKRKNINDTDFEVGSKKSKYGNKLNCPRQTQKSGKHNVSASFSRKSSINQKQLKTRIINAEKKKSQINFEKRKMNPSGNKSKLVIKKNGKKFVFPDRSKFSLKKMNCSNNVEDETQGNLTTTIQNDVAPQINSNHCADETNNDSVDYSCTIKSNNQIFPLEKQDNIKSSSNPEIPRIEANNIVHEKLKEQDIVIFSSPKNMKRIDSETPIHQSPVTPIKSTGLSFGHFSLKSIKPPNILTLKEIFPNHSALPIGGNKDDKKIEDILSKTIIESEQCLSTPERVKNAVVGLQQNNESSSNQYETPSKGKESHEYNEPVSSSKLLRTLYNDFDSSIGINDNSLEKTTDESSNKKQNTNDENVNDLELREKSSESVSKEQFLKTIISNKTLNDTMCSVDTSLKDLSNENESVSKSSQTKEKSLETQSNVLNSFVCTNESSLETSKIVPKSAIETCNSNKVDITDILSEKSLDNFVQGKKFLKSNVTHETDLLQKSQNDDVLQKSQIDEDLSVSSNINSLSPIETVTKSPNKNNEYKNTKQANSAESVTAVRLENLLQDKFLVKAKLSNTQLNEETINNNKPILEHTFEPRGFDIRLSKSIVAKLMKSAKTHPNTIVPKTIDVTKNKTKPDILMPENNVVDAFSVCSPLKTSQTPSTVSVENAGTKTKRKKGRRKKLIRRTASVQSNLKPPPLIPDLTENAISKIPCSPVGISVEKEKISVQTLQSALPEERVPLPQMPILTKDDPKRCPPKEITSEEVKEARVQKAPCILVNEPNAVAPPSSAESQTTDLKKKRQGKSPTKKMTRLTILKSKENSKPKPNEVFLNVKEKKSITTKEFAETPIPAALADNCISYQTPVQQKSTKSLSDIEIIEPKKEINDEPVVLQCRATHLLTNESFVDKIKLNESPDKISTDLNECTVSIDAFGNEQINPKYTIYELPAFIVMKTKIITRKDLESNKTLIPPVIKQQVDDESEDLITESDIKTERPQFNSVCAKINALLEQNANYLKFASGSERLTRMNEVLGDYSLSAEDANCTLKFLQSYLSSSPRDKAIKTRGQQFIPIYDSQKKIIGYRKRTIHVNPVSSRSSSRRTTKINSQPSVSVTTVNMNRSQRTVENGAELPPPKIEPDLLDAGESELIVPDTSPASDICIKDEEIITE